MAVRLSTTIVYLPNDINLPLLMDRISRLNLPDIDLRLLQAFAVLMSTRSVTLAAEEMNVTQPAISHQLSRLRIVFGDALFSRVGRRMEPTALAEELIIPVMEILSIWADRMKPERDFSPSGSTREFTICGSDIGELVLLPRLLEFVRMHAPDVRFRALPLLPNALAQSLEEGAIDLVFGGYPTLYAGVHEQVLYFEPYVCMAHEGHPIFEGAITLESFVRQDHLLVSARTMGHIHGEAERVLLHTIPEARLRVTTQSFLLGGLLAQRSDLILSAPRAVARALAPLSNLRCFECPVKLSGFAVKQYWHERMHRDPGHSWLRATIASLFQQSSRRIDVNSAGNEVDSSIP